MDQIFKARVWDSGFPCGKFVTSLADREIEFRVEGDTDRSGFYSIHILEGQPFWATSLNAEKKTRTLFLYDIESVRHDFKFEVDIPEDAFSKMFKKYAPKHQK